LKKNAFYVFFISGKTRFGVSIFPLSVQNNYSFVIILATLLRDKLIHSHVIILHVWWFNWYTKNVP